MTKIKGNIAKREQIKSIIVSDISANKLSPGERLMPIRKLAVQSGISTYIVHQALTDLVQENILECRGIRGFYVAQAIEGKLKNTKNHKIKQYKNNKAFLHFAHHSDLIWKRPSKEYARVRSEQLDFLAAMLKKYPDFQVLIEQSEVLRVYFEEKPEKLNIFKRAYQEGRLTLTGGRSIPDLNMISGETIVRLLKSGREWYRQTFGAEVDIDNRSDAFGMCSQLPQIAVKSGCRFLRPGRMPEFPADYSILLPFVWRGLDGSEIITVPLSLEINEWALTCNAPIVRTNDERLWEDLLTLRRNSADSDLAVAYTSEVGRLREKIIPMMKKVNAEQGSMQIEFGSYRDYCTRIDSSALPVICGEFNPVFTGCYTTRIELKKIFRELENQLFAAEMLAAGLKKPVDFSPIWDKFTLPTFHDGICGCIHDRVSEEIQSITDTVKIELKETFDHLSEELPAFSVFNPGTLATRQIIAFNSNEIALLGDSPVQSDDGESFAIVDLPPHGVRSFQVQKGIPAKGQAHIPMFSTKYFKVDFSQSYPVIEDAAGTFRREGFGEIVCRHECGSMWSERFGGLPKGRECQQEKVLSVEEGPLFFKVATEGEVLAAPDVKSGFENDVFHDGGDSVYWWNFKSLKFRKIYRFYKELDYFSVKVILDWQGNNTKIQFKIPLNLNATNAVGLYHVPFGVQARGAYYDVKKCYSQTLVSMKPETLNDAGGDWPALHFVDYSDFDKGCAVANSGTPGCQCVNGDILISLLRSGTMCLDGNLTPQEGAYSCGRHEYEFVVLPHCVSDNTAVLRAGELLNRRALAINFDGKKQDSALINESFLECDAANVVISSFRLDQGKLIVRLYESAGSKCRTKLKSKFGDKLLESDLQELDWTPIDGELEFKPFEIKTVWISQVE